MFKSIKVTSGFAADLPALKGRTFEFKPGINILFGPNGCGKTSLLRILGAYTGQDHGSKAFGGGWSKVPRAFHFGDKKPNYPDELSEGSPGKCKADVDWDGTPCFYNSASLSDSMSYSAITWDAKDAPDGLESSCGAHSIQMMFAHPSEGQLRVSKIKNVYDTMMKPPKWPPEKDKYNEAFVDYLATKPCKGYMTLLWDEPDRSLDVPNQVAMWTNFLPQIGNSCQIICATHSFCPLLLTQAPFLNIIDVQEGYLAKAKNELLNVFAIHEFSERVKDDDAKKEVPGELASTSEPAPPAKSRSRKKS